VFSKQNKKSTTANKQQKNGRCFVIRLATDSISMVSFRTNQLFAQPTSKRIMTEGFCDCKRSSGNKATFGSSCRKKEVLKFGEFGKRLCGFPYTFLRAVVEQNVYAMFRPRLINK